MNPKMSWFSSLFISRNSQSLDGSKLSKISFHLLLIEATWNPTNIQNRGRILPWFKFMKFATRSTFQWQKFSSMLIWFIIDSIDPFQTFLLRSFLCLRPHFGMKTLKLDQQKTTHKNPLRTTNHHELCREPPQKTTSTTTIKPLRKPSQPTTKTQQTNTTMNASYGETTAERNWWPSDADGPSQSSHRQRWNLHCGG